MEEQEKKTKVDRAAERMKRAQAEYKKAVREEKARARKEQDHAKFMMGGIVVKYFPEAYDFSELELNRIIACAFSLKDVQNMIQVVLNERPVTNAENEEEEHEENEPETAYDECEGGADDESES